MALVGQFRPNWHVRTGRRRLRRRLIGTGATRNGRDATMTLGPATSTHGPAEMARVSGPVGGPVGGPVSREEPAVMVTRTCPDCATEVGSDDLICFTCGANLPRVLSADEPPPP